jgi:hypothetical protein
MSEILTVFTNVYGKDFSKRMERMDAYRPGLKRLARIAPDLKKPDLSFGSKAAYLEVITSKQETKP